MLGVGVRGAPSHQRPVGCGLTGPFVLSQPGPAQSIAARLSKAEMIIPKRLDQGSGGAVGLDAKATTSVGALRMA
uniref:Uncharacterized protein n=1 Tax=Anguilla anguilla TaxID=7936 RepID=A0A0E9PBL3_ANGAN